MEQQNPPGKPFAVLEWVVIKQCPGELGVFQDSALKGQIAFSCSKSRLSSPRRTAQVLIYYWACLKRHLGKSTKRQIGNTTSVPGALCLLTEGAEFTFSDMGRATMGRWPGVLGNTCWCPPSSRCPEVSDAGGERQQAQPPYCQFAQISEPWPRSCTLYVVGTAWWGRDFVTHTSTYTVSK